MRYFGVTLLLLLACTESDETRRDRFFLQGNEALANREWDKAKDFFSKALEVDTRFAQAYNNRGVAKMEDGEAYEAIQDYNIAIALDSAYFEAVFNRAYAYEQTGRIQNALDDLAAIRRVYPDSSYLYFYQGLLHSRLRDYPRGISSFQQALELDSAIVEAQVNLATLYFYNGQPDTSKILIRKILQETPNEANALNTLSQVYLQEDDFQNALISINQALKLVPSEAYFLNNRGQIYLEMEQWEKALEDINRSILLDPKNGWAYRNKGLYYLRTGDAEQAIRLFERALASGDFIDEVYCYLGEAQFANGQPRQACDAWKKGTELGERKSAALYSQKCQ